MQNKSCGIAKKNPLKLSIKGGSGYSNNLIFMSFFSTQFELLLLAVCVTWEGEKYVDKRIQLCWCVV